MTITADDLVRREVYYCVSSLVHTLATDYGRSFENNDLHDLIEQAYELAAPLEDYEEAAREAGWRLHSSDAGREDWRRGADDSEEYATGAQDACYADDIEPYYREVFEHWIVSEWLADKLAAKGEKVMRDFAGLTVWARTTTGQAIKMDSVIEEIVAEINKPDTEEGE